LGDVQASEMPGTPGPVSLHSNVEPGSDAVKMYVAVVDLVGPLGPDVIVVTGGAVRAPAAGGAANAAIVATSRIDTPCIETS
jgi:hypothetical protein